MGKNSFNIEKSVSFSVIVVFALSITLLLIVASVNFPSFDFPAINFSDLRREKLKDIKKFSSETDFKNYLAASFGLSNYYGGFGRGGVMMNQEMAPTDAKSATGIGGGASERVSETNVQVIGFDEPDIVKTDGKEIYFSGTQRYYYGPIMRGNIGTGISFEEQKMIAPDAIRPYPITNEETKIIKAFPPADLTIDGKIDKQGDLLLDKNNLIIFSNASYYESSQEINGYDVSNPKSPAKKWTIKLDNNTSVIASRLRNGKIYLITRNNINTPRPCPLKPLTVDGIELNIKCANIYHPVQSVPIDSTFVAMILNSNTGKIENTVSFVGSSGSSVIYISENAIYASYAYNESIAKFFSGFIKENSSFFPAWVAEKVNKLEGYDISENSKLSELMEIIQKYTNSLSSDEQLKTQNEMTKRMSDYYKNHKRDLEKTGIVKIDLAKFSMAASGIIPGHLLNNFAMDEYLGNLRVATTVGSRWGVFNGIGIGESVNDVYVLDKNLKTFGSVQDLGKTEQIYSARFIEDRGYVVTFKQTDPFYVLDLANPKNPVMAGELKIPGYSSYLHPLDATHILGIGMEANKVKISLFDVSDKNNPAELSKYMLDEYWSEVSNNYHAFLLDKKHNIFFLPGSKGGYVFSYQNYNLEIKKAISQNSVKRAIYINDYLYIIGEDKITVLNEIDWEKVNELSIK